MRGASTGTSYSRPFSGRKTLRRCRNNEEADNVILIDVDSDHFDNVIIIDAPDSLPRKRQGSSILRKDKKQPLQTVICIDDDESPYKFHCFADASSSRSFIPPTVDFDDVDAEESPYKFHCFADASSGRSFIPPTKDFDDVDAEESPFIQENVTPVRLSKCKRTYSGKASTGRGYGLNLDSENDLSADDHSDCELLEDTSGKVQEQWEKAFCRRKKGIKNYQSGARSQNGASRIINDNSHQTFGREGENDEHMVAPYHFHTWKFINEDEGHSPLSKEEVAHYSSTYVSLGDSKHSPSIHTEQEDHQHFEPGSFSCHNGKRLSYSSSYASHHEQATKEVKKTKSHVDGNSDYGKASLVGVDEFVSNGNGEEDKDDDFHIENGHTVDFAESGMIGEREKLKETNQYKTAMEEEWASRQQVIKIQAEEAQHLRHLQKRRRAENGPTMDSVESCMIGEREKFKETDEYKRAMEEEWACRQQALKIQAEEVQHLRRLQKRRKAENMRLLDMERRQKERIEEMRSTQKKDEENMNMREVIRTEVRKELSKLEMASENMVSLLHSFGIQIAGWPNPSPQEVQTAYKRALLTFHPDRALLSDVRQQVEAEEKFKLMNRFKEKFSFVL